MIILSKHIIILKTIKILGSNCRNSITYKLLIQYFIIHIPMLSLYLCWEFKKLYDFFVV